MRRTRLILPLLMIAIGLAGAAGADPFAGGWVLQPSASSLRFQSVKNLTKVEVSNFATYDGEIAPDGTATVRVQLDSVDTGVDLRNVRMRFLFFETFEYPTATITASIDPALVANLAETRRKTLPLTYTLDLHGQAREMTTEAAVTLITDDLVSVSSAAPISVAAADHALENGIRKLEEAASVKIVPSATVTFDFVFARAGGTPETVVTAAADPAEAPKPAPAALEPEGNFDLEACKGRFEILSRTDNIYFRTGSARLDDRSSFLLDSIADIVARCPGLRIEVGGHTDAVGSEAANRTLSERRAAAVARYLAEKGIGADRMSAVGYGESRPVAPNDTAENMRRNRRIEFTVLNG